MPGQRSRQGCDECRRRRRKCDENKPTCEACATRNSPCHYPLRLVWDGRRGIHHHHHHEAHDPNRNSKNIRKLPPQQEQQQIAITTTTTTTTTLIPPAVTPIPTSLPNGIPLPSRYLRLLAHFSQHVLPSLSCHPSINSDLCTGLIPATLHTPHLLSACLALSAAGFVWRGVQQVDGIPMDRILGHLQSSGLTLLRTAMGDGGKNADDLVVATCLIWCLTDVFSYRQDTSSWRIHLHGIKAILDGNPALRYVGGGGASGREEQQSSSSSPTRSAMRHLYLLYLSLQTLPFIPSTQAGHGHGEAEEEVLLTPHTIPNISTQPSLTKNLPPSSSPQIDGFLGYSADLLHILQRIDQISASSSSSSHSSSLPPEEVLQEAHTLYSHLQTLIQQDSQSLSPPTISSIPLSSLTPQAIREFSLCHRTFQQAVLIHLCRVLFRFPSSDPIIVGAVGEIRRMLGEMSEVAGAAGKMEACHTWVAMAMPLFTMGCEAYTQEDQEFVARKVDELEQCLGSRHVGIMRGALGEVWRVRGERGDMSTGKDQGDWEKMGRGGGGGGGGRLCSGELLGKLNYNIILF